MWNSRANTEFQSASLRNGIAVYALHVPGYPWQHMGFVVHSGAEQDFLGKAGTAEFVASLLPYNSNNPSPRALSEYVRTKGGYIRPGSVNRYRTYFQFGVPLEGERTGFSLALESFGIMLLSARLANAVDSRRSALIQKFYQAYPFLYEYQMKEERHRALYRDACVQVSRIVDPIGTPEALRQIDQPDAQAYYDRCYVPANISVIAVGGISPEDLMRILEAGPFSLSKQGKRVRLPIPVRDIALPSSTGQTIVTSRFTKEGFSRAVPALHVTTALPGDCSIYAVRLLSDMLNEALHHEVCEYRGWAHEIESSFEDFRYVREFRVRCDAFDPGAVNEIRGVVAASIASLQNQQAAFERCKEALIAEQSRRGDDLPALCGEAGDELACRGMLASSEERREEIGGVILNDVIRLISWLDEPKRRYTVLVKP